MTLVRTSHGARGGRRAAMEPEGDRAMRSASLAPGPLLAARTELLRSARLDARGGHALLAIRKLDLARQLSEVLAVESYR